MEGFLQILPIFIVFGLILLFVFSFILLVKTLLINPSVRGNKSNELEKKLDILIEQNEKIISLLKEQQ